MTITNREDSISYLSEVLTKEQLANIISHNYSDQALAVMAEFDRGYVERFANTLYDTESMEKLIGAYRDKLIDWKDLLHIAEYSCYDFMSEEYLDQFIHSIESKQIDHTTASRILTATAYEFDTYNGQKELVRSGAYYPTQHASIALNPRVAAELRDLGVPLTAMRKEGTYYDLTQKSEFDEAVRKGDRIKLVKYPKLAVEVIKLMKNPDWQDFKAWFQKHEGIDRTKLLGTELNSHYRFFSIERYANKLVDKVATEHTAFIEDMKKRQPEEIIGAAYEIVIKEQIKMFMTEVPQYLPESKTDALMSSRNTLNDIYEQWRSEDDLADTDIEIIIDNTADKIIANREREQKLAAELAKKAQADVLSDKPKFMDMFKRKKGTVSIITRAESMEKLSNKVDNVEYAKIVSHHFSDYVLEVMVNSSRELADRLAHTKLTNEGVERLVKAYDSNIITYGDLLHITNYSLVSGGSEKYLNDYFSSIAAGLDTKTATRILVAAKFEDWSYNEIRALVESGTYQVGDNTFVVLNPDVAREIDKLGMELFAYDKSNDFYLVKDIEQAIANGDSITFSRSALAVKINEMCSNPDWEAFRNYIAEDMEDIEHLTADGLVEAYKEYRVEELNIELSRKVDRNFEAFIHGIREQGVDEAISRCYEITVKTNIQSYIESEPADISEEQYNALISCDNPLDEIYSAWLKREYLKTYDDIPKAMEYAADSILESKKRVQEKDSEMLSNKSQLPKKKGGSR